MARRKYAGATLQSRSVEFKGRPSDQKAAIVR